MSAAVMLRNDSAKGNDLGAKRRAVESALAHGRSLFHIELRRGQVQLISETLGTDLAVARSLLLLAIVIFLLPSGLAAAESQPPPRLAPADLVRAVIRNELNAPKATEIRRSYQSDKEVDGKKETREVVETKSGSLDRLLSVAGQPLSEVQQRKETERILRLSQSPEEQHKVELAHRKDMQQGNAFLEMMQNAFLFEYGGTSGALVKVMFKPNPNFHPSSFESKILHEMQGEMWVHATQLRLVSITGELIDEVKFAGGLLGHLEKGGQFVVKRVEVAPANWEIQELNVNMHGKALLFKTIAVQQKELHSNFQPVPDNLTLSDAANLLLKQAFVAQHSSTDGAVLAGYIHSGSTHQSLR